uniref:NR LBD domain-containing protein n=1 Tax=Panagrellus redivivus TaxID=6233 RepID=A0A7E4WAK6_PANRE
MTKIASYFIRDHDGFKELRIDKQTFVRLFQLSYLSLTKVVTADIAPIDPAFDEVLFLIGLKLYDPTIPNISSDTQTRLQQLRNLLIDEMAVTYKKIRMDANQRINSLLKTSKALEVYAHRLREDMLLFKCFNFVPFDDVTMDKGFVVPDLKSSVEKSDTLLINAINWFLKILCATPNRVVVDLQLIKQFD